MTTTKQQVGSVQVELSKQYEFDGAKTNYVVMREPTVADQLTMSEMAGSDTHKEICMFANLCQITPDQIKALSLRDYKKVQAAFLAFTD